MIFVMYYLLIAASTGSTFIDGGSPLAVAAYDLFQREGPSDR